MTLLCLIFSFAQGLKTTSTNLNLSGSSHFPGRVAQLYLALPKQAASSTFKLLAPTELQVRLDTGGANVSTLKTHIYYPKDLVSVASLDFTNSICSFISQQTVDRERGIIAVSCLTPTAITTQLNHFFSILLTPTNLGSAYFRFDLDQSQVQTANSGNPDVLYQAQAQAFAILQNNQYPEAALAYADPSLVQDFGSSKSMRLSITSPTHPRTLNCSTSSLAEMRWIQPVGVASFLYALDSSPSTVNPSNQTISRSLDLPTTPNSIQYFHLQAVSGSGQKGPVTTYPITTCP